MWLPLPSEGQHSFQAHDVPSYDADFLGPSHEVQLLDLDKRFQNFAAHLSMPLSHSPLGAIPSP